MSDRVIRYPFSGLAVSALALAAFAALALSGTPASADEREQLAYVTKKAAILANIHRKAKRALVNAAQDRAFESYFTAHDAHGRHAAKQRIEQVSLATQRRFEVEEMCLIDASGPEIARIVGNAVAPDSDLSPDESGAGFFAPGFAEQPRRVYVSRPYLSPDADKWVIAYVTPVVVEGERKALLHYEHGLDVYQAILNDEAAANGRFLIAVSPGGHVIADSRGMPAVQGRDGNEDPAAYFKRIDATGPQGLAGVYRGIGERQTGTAQLSADGTDYDVAFAVVDDGTVLLAVAAR